MIARLIDACIRNRALVLLLAAALIGTGIWSMFRINVDAIPDLSDVQVVISTEFPGQAPQIVEDQITYPLTTAMMSVPKTSAVRGFSMFGTSFVYVIFEDGTDIYWARSRVLEQLSTVAGRLPAQARPQLGPDASGVGWVFQYVLTTGKHSPAHPNGFWHDPVTSEWFTSPDQAASRRVAERLVRYRVLPPHFTNCPVSGRPLLESDLDLSELRSLQDWYLRYELTALRGVSEVASAGGFVKQYQVTVDPVRLLAFNLSLDSIRNAIQASNLDAGGGSIEISETEYMVRGIGYLGSLTGAEVQAAQQNGIPLSRVRTQKILEELRNIPLEVARNGIALRLGDVAGVQAGPDVRRGIIEWNGEGETVGAIVVMRHGENARDTIQRVRTKLLELERGLPPGVAIEVGYDRSDLIDRSIQTLSRTLAKEMAVVMLVILIFLLHARSSLVAAFVLPSAVLASIILMHLLGINANIMSLGGIAIAIGVLVDSSIIMVENAHKHFEWERERLASGAAPRSRLEIIAEAAREVGPTLFFSLLVITISFLPVFLLGEQSGRLFKPLAFTKTFAMGAAAFLAVTVVPVLMVYFISERVVPERWQFWRRMAVYAGLILVPALLLSMVPLDRLEPYRWWAVILWLVLSAMFLLPQKIKTEKQNPVTTLLEKLYTPLFALAIRFRWALVLGALALVVLTALFPLRQLGSEFMPPLEEGDLLYMPTTVEPGLSITKAKELLQHTDRLLMQFPEIKSVKGKIGRAESATDPAPMNMIETTITLHRDPSQWRRIPVVRFYSNWPSWLRWLPSRILPETRTITLDELIYGFHLPDGTPMPGTDTALQIPGIANSWTMPIRTRIDMLATGIRTPVGIKVMGPDLTLLATLAQEMEDAIKTDPRTASYSTSVIAERTMGGKYLDIRPRRKDHLERYGLTVADVQEAITTAIGGMTISQTVEGLERYPVNLRYPRELRDSIPTLQQTMVSTPGGTLVPLAQLADFQIQSGPPMIKSENARPTAWIYIDIAGMDVGSYVRRAQQVVNENVLLPPGYSVVWSGQFEYMQQARERMMVAIPLTLLSIFILLYFATGSWLRVLLIFTTLSFSVLGAIWFVWLLDYNLSLAVLVGIIALLGLDAETSLIMLLYLDNSYKRFETEGRLRSLEDVWRAVYHGAVMRIRPKTMTVMTTILGLMPLMFATGAGADTMRRLAAPMIGGLVTSFILELLIYPAIYYMARSYKFSQTQRKAAAY